MKLFDLLSPGEQIALGLTGKPCRVVISAAIDVHTRCVVGMNIVPEKHRSPLRDTLEVIYLDKGSISDAAGYTHTWSQGGMVETIVLDRGSNYISD